MSNPTKKMNLFAKNAVLFKDMSIDMKRPKVLILMMIFNGVVASTVSGFLLYMLTAGMGIGFLSSLGRQLAVHDVNMNEVLQTIGISFFMGLFFIALMVPIRIRFPGDQGRIAMGILMGITMLSAALVSRSLPGGAEKLASGLAGLSMPVIFALIAGLTLIVTVISYILSVRWIRRKEF